MKVSELAEKTGLSSLNDCEPDKEIEGVYISDMVDMLIKAATSPAAPGEAFNVGTGRTTDVAELAQMLIKVMGLKNVEVSFTGGQAWEGDMDITLADNSKAKKMLQWSPQVSLEEGLKRLIDSEKY